MIFQKDVPREECGVVGVYSSDAQSISKQIFFGLYALQHRGQESAGICTSDGNKFNVHKGMGLVAQVFEESIFDELKGNIGIGHTRYSTTGSSKIENAQPFLTKSYNLNIALAHNGNVINSKELKKEIIDSGYHLSSSSDSEIIAHLIAYAPAQSWKDRIAYCMRKIQGAYSLVLMDQNELIGIRDPLGVRPLCIGKKDNQWVIASESCALDHMGAEFVREVNPGEAVLINKNGINTIYQRETGKNMGSCVFEHIYFARPDSKLNGALVYKNRMAMGAELAKEFPVEADMVIGVPDSATAAAVGYSQESGIPFGEGLVKNRYVGRTFIIPDQILRDIGVRWKLNLLSELIEGKKIVVVDDSIVRGTTTPHVVNLLRKGGAKEIHFRICAPPIISPCHFGVDMATKNELLAANMEVEEIRKFIGADSLGYLSNEGLMKSVKEKRNNLCMGCFTGVYPIPVQLEMDKLILETES